MHKVLSCNQIEPKFFYNIAGDSTDGLTIRCGAVIEVKVPDING
jgi:hypothetical protein